ncbi:hypothetical protein C8J57DRAFT_1227473 [Mycena rebaudengoi]|nr:hypothetical protein C8J57DRAFT_1227473 [Mycena rebaudengoi]
MQLRAAVKFFLLHVLSIAAICAQAHSEHAETSLRGVAESASWLRVRGTTSSNVAAATNTHFPGSRGPAPATLVMMNRDFTPPFAWGPFNGASPWPWIPTGFPAPTIPDGTSTSSSASGSPTLPASNEAANANANASLKARRIGGILGAFAGLALLLLAITSFILWRRRLERRRAQLRPPSILPFVAQQQWHPTGTGSSDRKRPSLMSPAPPAQVLIPAPTLQLPSRPMRSSPLPSDDNPPPIYVESPPNFCGVCRAPP